MKIDLDPALEATLERIARQRGLSVEEVVIKAIKERFPSGGFQPRDEWERRLLEIGVDCGASLSDEAFEPSRIVRIVARRTQTS